MADPYDDPYDLSPASILSGTAFNAGDPTELQGILSRRNASIQGREQQAQGVMQQQRAQSEKMMQLLDSTAARIRESRAGRGTNLPLLALGAGMMGPGDFGTQVGRGLRAMVPAIQQERAADDETEMKLLGLETQKAKIAMDPLQNELAYIRAIQQGDMAAARSIETQLARAKGQAAKGPTGKMAIIEQLKADALKEGKTMSTKEALSIIQEMSERQPAELQMLEQYRKDSGNPNAGLIDMKRDVKWNEAYSRKTGELTGTNRMGLETTEQNLGRATQTIAELLADEEGKKYAVGSMLSSMPALPGGGPKGDFLAKHDYLTKQVYATAVQDMRGLGALSEMEGLAIAASKLNAARSQTKEAYDQALRDFQAQLQHSYEIAKRNAGVSPARDFSRPPPPITSQGTGTPVSPPSQTGLKAPSFREGDRATSPGKPDLIFRNGRWVQDGR